MGPCTQYLNGVLEGCVIVWVLEKKQDGQPPHRGVDPSSDPESPAQSDVYGDLELKRDFAKLLDEMPGDLPTAQLYDLIRLGEVERDNDDVCHANVSSRRQKR